MLRKGRHIECDVKCDEPPVASGTNPAASGEPPATPGMFICTVLPAASGKPLVASGNVTDEGPQPPTTKEAGFETPRNVNVQVTRGVKHCAGFKVIKLVLPASYEEPTEC